MPSSLRFDNIINNIKHRSWEKLNDILVKNITPSTSTPYFPTEKFYDLPELQKLLINANAKPDSPVFSSNVSGVRNLIFYESLYYFYKSINVLSVSQTISKKGFQTYSMSSSYQSAYYSALSIIHLLGVSFPQYNNKYFLLDLYILSSQKLRKIFIEDEMCIRILPIKLLEHKHVWEIFLRIIRIFKIEDNIWPEKLLIKLKNILIKEFPKQRNYIQYGYNEWLFEDLITFITEDQFKYRSNKLITGLDYKLKSDFTLVLAISLNLLNYRLLKDISKYTNVIKSDIELIESLLNDPYRFPLNINIE